MKASKAGKSPVQAFELAPSRPDPGQQAQTSGQKEGVPRSKATDDKKSSKSATGVMATLLSTMSRRNRVGPESEAVAKASREFDSITTEEERYTVLKTIRQLSCPMATKRQLMEKLMAGPVMESHGLKQLKFENKRRWNRVKEGWQNFKYALEPWRSALRKIEGNHGSGVVSYFVFLRYLLLVNFCMFLLTMFIWVPEAISTSTALVSGSTAETCTAAYTVNVSSDAFTLILDFFQGSGWMEKTAVFYGYYSGNGLEDTDYKLSLAYILVCIACLLSSLMLMGRHVAASFRESILNSGDGTTEFCNKVFGSWDYTLSDCDSAAIKGKSVRIEFLSDINEQQFLTEREERLKVGSKKCKLYAIRILINCFIVCVLGASAYLIYYVTTFSTEASAYLIYYVTTFSTEYVSENADVSGTDKVLLKLLVQFLPAITMAVLNGALPIIFQKVVVGEEYTTAFVIKITLIRTVFLRLASLTVLMITLYTEVTCSTRDTCMTTRSPCNVITCWETYVGQQLYKLIIMDFLIVFVKTLLVELPRRLFYEKCSCGLMQKVGPPEFDIPSNVLDLVYSQCLYWLSLSFAPLTPGFSVIKVIATFYLKMLSALKACPPAEQPYRASRTNTFFMFILLVAFFLCSVPIGYTLYSLEPSHGCGPFRIYTHMYDAITTTVDNWPSTPRSIYELIISPAVTAPVIIFLCLLIYYCSVLASAHKSTSDMFREQVVMEGRDKQFLLLKVKELGGDSNPLPKKPHKNPPRGINRLQNAKQTNGGVGAGGGGEKGSRGNSNLSQSLTANEGVGSKGHPTSPHMPVEDDGW